MNMLLHKIVIVLALVSCGFGYTHAKTQDMDTSKLTQPVVRKAVEALQAGNSATWYALFTADAELYDDGRKMDLRKFFDAAIGHERFTGIDKVENKGLDIYGHFHSDTWGDFKTYFKFHLNAEGKISKLEIGQASH